MCVWYVVVFEMYSCVCGDMICTTVELRAVECRFQQSMKVQGNEVIEQDEGEPSYQHLCSGLSHVEFNLGDKLLEGSVQFLRCKFLLFSGWDGTLTVRAEGADFMLCFDFTLQAVAQGQAQTTCRGSHSRHWYATKMKQFIILSYSVPPWTSRVDFIHPHKPKIPYTVKYLQPFNLAKWPEIA